MGTPRDIVTGTAKKAVASHAAPYVALALAVLGGLMCLVLVSSFIIESTSNSRSSVDDNSAQVLVDAGVVSEDNYDTLVQATDGTNVPWQMLAVISYGETDTTTDTASLRTQTQAPFTFVSDSVSSPLAWAYKQEGLHYRWSGPYANETGCGPFGPLCYDCSGLTWSAFNQFGIDIGRTPPAQYDGWESYGGQRISTGDDSNLQVGDLLFWYDHSRGKMGHVAFYAGNGMIFDAANPSLLIGLRELHLYDSSLEYMPWAVRVPGAGDGVGLPEANSSSTVSNAASATSILTGGNGPFHLSDGALDSQGYADQAVFVANQLSTVASQTGFAVDVYVDDDSTVTLLDDEDATQSEAESREEWVEALASLPITGMNEVQARRVYDMAKDWYMGIVSSSSSGQCHVVNSHPDELAQTDGLLSVTRNRNGVESTVALSDVQVTNAQAIYTAAVGVGATHKELMALFMTALAESALTNHAINGQGMQSYCTGTTQGDLNRIATASQSVPHDDVVAGDCDSVGLFQQRETSGWGPADKIMDPAIATLNFLGADGRVATARGLRQISGWEAMDEGELAQAVQGSRFPERYNEWKEAAEQLIKSMGDVVCDDSSDVSGQWALPVPTTATISSPFGYRSLVVAGSHMHTGVDFAAPVGTPIYAIHGGVVAYVGKEGESQYYSGAFVIIDHGDGQWSVYNHMYNSGVHVSVGDEVNAGQQIAEIGNAGRSTGPHVHVGLITSDSLPLVPLYSQLADPLSALRANGIDTTLPR